MTNILKTSAITLAALIGVAAAAAPALADGSYKDGFDPSYYLTQLNYQGINAVAADEVTKSVFRATIVNGGHTTFAFFDRDSLQQLKD